MNTQLSIKNFRVFDEHGVRIDIKPLTILTGCNSSGKSSIVKAAFLLNSFMKQVNEAVAEGEEIQLSKYKLDFTGYPNNLLGRFDKVIPEGSSSRLITLGYSIHSYMLSKDVDVQLFFAADENDDLNNAYLVSLSMSVDEGVFYSSDKKNGSVFNLNLIKKFCPDFVKIEFLLNNFCRLNSEYEFNLSRSISFDEFKSQGKAMLDILHGLDRTRVIDVANYIRYKKGGGDCIGNKEHLDLFEWTEENDSLFNIPVLKHLNSIRKENIVSYVEKELIPEDENNALCVSLKAITVATKKVLNEYIQSEYDAFEVFFKSFEHRYLEEVNCHDKKSPCMPNLVLSQSYASSYPGHRRGAVSLFEEDSNNEELSKEEKEIATQQRVKEWENRSLTFDMLYETVMLWNEKYEFGKNEYFYVGQEIPDAYGVTLYYPDGYHHFVFNMLTAFAKRLVEESISPIGFDNMSYISSSRATVKKLYALDEKDNFTGLLQRYFEVKRQFLEKNTVKSSNTPDYEVNSFMSKWIRRFGLGEFLSFQLDEEGLGVKIRLHKSSEDSGRLLSDEGYGVTQLISILLQIESAILSAKGENTNDYYGLSTFDKYDTSIFHFEENTIAIEEPEIHLHPRFQSMLAELFVEAYQKYNIHFIIETHSEYLIRKLQVMVASKDCSLKSEKVSLNYVDKREDGTSFNKKIIIKEDGDLNDSFGSGFYDEADDLAIQLFRNKPILS